MAEGADTEDAELPPGVVEEAERLTRLARSTPADAEAAAYREDRAQLLADHGFTARVRDDDRATLVVHPAEWVEDGTVRPERIDDLDRGIERPLEGVGEADEWAEVAAHNDDLAETVGVEHGPVHGANARAFAEFMNNHYAKPAEAATAAEVAEFLTEYYPRNVWPTDDQSAVVEESVRLVFAAADERVPTGRPE